MDVISIESTGFNDYDLAREKKILERFNFWNENTEKAKPKQLDNYFCSECSGGAGCSGCNACNGCE